MYSNIEIMFQTTQGSTQFDLRTSIQLRDGVVSKENPNLKQKFNSLSKFVIISHILVIVCKVLLHLRIWKTKPIDMAYIYRTV